MLAHKSGMIGLPLLLLAREVYDRIVRLRGPHEVALITGEEKIVPKAPRFYVCTVESMPLDIAVACLVIDEIQLCADPERGHVFTDRLLHARGLEETMLLGSDTMRGIIQKFVPKVWFISRARLPTSPIRERKNSPACPPLGGGGIFRPGCLWHRRTDPPTARRRRRGAWCRCAQRTRNAQVELYQSGDVDFLVATDAIGMGLNMDVDHTPLRRATSSTARGCAICAPARSGQIAGRAGRYMNDGTFGVTGDCEPFEDELGQRVETHRYDPVRVLQWRNAELDFRSLAALNQSLDTPPPERGLTRARAPPATRWR
jgi:ATP-dependent RNA helicase SUPV3L1/SUV3